MTATIFEALAAPFPPEKVSWRVGTSNKKKRQRETNDNYAKATKGMALAYIDARDVMERLDDVCGPGGWQCRYPHAEGKTVCEIGISVGGEWIWKADGAGDTDIEASKGALSDAFKRAAVRWGIGRYLYGISSPWCDLDEREQIIDADRKKLEGLLKAATTTIEWGDPEDRATVKALASTIRTLVTTPEDVSAFRETCGGTIAQLRVKAREHIETLLARVAGEQLEEAA
jgi:hypothetical protein